MPFLVISSECKSPVIFLKLNSDASAKPLTEFNTPALPMLINTSVKLPIVAKGSRAKRVPSE